MREQDTGQREAQGGLFFFYKAIKLPLPIYKQCAYILALKYTDQVGYCENEEGASFAEFFSTFKDFIGCKK